MKKMKNRPVVILSGCLALSVMIVFVLFALTEDKSAKRYDFVRVFPANVISEDTVLDLQSNSYYIAGTTVEKIYFGNSLAPLHIIESNKELTDTSHIRLRVTDTSLKFKTIQVKIDSPYFFITEGTQPYLLRGKINDWEASRFMFDKAYFSLAVPVSPSSFVIRSRNVRTGEDMLGKETLDHVKPFPGLLEKQFDGVFCVDGMLHFNKERQAVVYVYYYRNQYIVMDTSLNLVYKGNTIDPISTAQIKADSFSSKEAKTYTMSAPPLLVNRYSCVYGDWLLVNSAIRSQNENEESIQNASIIDVYDLKNTTYQFSFYIKRKEGNELEGLWVSGQNLYVMFGDNVVGYTIHHKVFNKSLMESL